MTGAEAGDEEPSDCCAIFETVVGATHVLDRLGGGAVAVDECEVLTSCGLCLLCNWSSIAAGGWWSVTRLLSCVNAYSISVYASQRPACDFKVFEKQPAGVQRERHFARGKGSSGELGRRCE